MKCLVVEGLSYLFQVVGVCAEELRAAQHWNGIGVLDLMKTINVSVTCLDLSVIQRFVYK